MATNCKTACDLPVMGMGTQSKNNKIYVSVIDPIQGCINIKTSDYSSISSPLGTPTSKFQKLKRPKDQMNCPEPLCITTGTLNIGFIATEEGTPTSTTVRYLVDDSSKDYINGVISAYVILYGAGTYEIDFNITDQCGGTTVKLSRNVVGGSSEIYPKQVLVQHALAEATTLLPNSDCGMSIEVVITPSNTTPVSQLVGLSSISMVKDKSEFEQNETIAITCIDELDFPNDVDLTDPTCLGQSPDPDSVSLELTITAQQVTGNFLRLNPLLHKLDDTKGFAVECLGKTIEAITVNGINYWGVRLPNFYGEECSFVSAYLPSCDANEGRLIYNSILNLAQPDLENFKIITDESSGDKFMVVNKDYVGEELTILYPIEKNVIKWEASTDFVEGRKVRILIPFKFKNGWEGFIKSENAFCTSFPFGFSSTEDTALDFTFVFMREGKNLYNVDLIEA